MTDLPPFVYDTLSAREFRLLIPDASVSEPGLSWTLKNVNIDDPDLRFISLSYAWATQSHPTTFPIRCNGRQLRVHHNLYTALPSIARHVSVDGSLGEAYWIDAICINQADDGEKTSQIQLMKTIYQTADKVLVWLGLAMKPEWQELIPRAIELLPLLIEEHARCRQLNNLLDNNIPIDRRLSHLGRDGWEAILHLVRNPYFRRVWIVQEIALAKRLTFLCGDHEIAPQQMQQAVSDNHLIRDWAIYDAKTSERMRMQATFHDDNIVFFIRDIVKYSGDEGNAHQTIRIANLLDSQICFAPQDRVLGILGMVEKELGDASTQLHAYTSIANLYTRFSTLVFEASGLTKIHWWFYLSMAFNKTRIDGLPSWVPDLHHNDSESKRQPYESMLTARVYSDPPWQASSRPRRGAHGPRSGEIMLRGKLLDVVTLVHPEVPQFPDEPAPGLSFGMTWLAALISLIKWESQLADTVLYNFAAETRVSEDTYWRTLLADIHKDIAPTPQLAHEAWLRFRKAGQHLLDLVPRLEELNRTTGTDPWNLPHWTDSAEEKETMNCFRNAQNCVKKFTSKLCFTCDHQLINTKEGRFGFTCTGVRAGDVVCVFNDSVSPFVLRRVEDRDGDVRYQFVGDAYVHGLMYGEADRIDVDEVDVLLV